MDATTIDYPNATYQPASIWPTALKWGAISGFASIILTLVSYNMGLMDLNEDGTPPSTTLSSVISFLIYGAVIFLGMKEYRDGSNYGQLSLGRAILWSLGYALVLGVISAVFTMIFYSVIAPDYLSEILEAQLAAMEEQGMSDEQLEATESMMAATMSPVVMGLGAVIFSLIISAIVGLVCGLILRRER